MDNSLIRLSESILLSVKLGYDTSLLRRELYFVKDKKLHSFLNNDELKGIFWTNIYNAYVLIMNLEKINEKTIFQVKRIKVAKYALSLDDIEHKILRMGNHRGIFLVMNNLFCPNFIKNNAVEKVDFDLKIRLDKSPVTGNQTTNYK
ncbi:DUF547 domain-containing protein [Flavobacterium acetivorans]|uniref:DUF547 domain-containing protein n=1 Tax=Flavobacterium acetivorans TaxID=2893883 RepID=UPI001E5F3B7A|nr:DUF547 domain-containing protein [Flavobacterium sp. F-29]UFH36212.1 DUF547 domain-containing protein [Flavobacterium sp. F-29]